MVEHSFERLHIHSSPDCACQQMQQGRRLSRNERRAVAQSKRCGQCLESISEESTEKHLAFLGTEADEGEVDSLIGMYESGGLKLQSALDSGAVDHVVNPDDLPGYAMGSSSGSIKGAHFHDASGNTVHNI